MAPYDQLTARKKCVAITLSDEGLSTRKMTKKLNCHHSEVSINVQLKHETGDVGLGCGVKVNCLHVEPGPAWGVPSVRGLSMGS